MAANRGAISLGINFIGEFVEDASNFKIIPKFRDPKATPRKQTGQPKLSAQPPKKPKKKKDK